MTITINGTVTVEMSSEQFIKVGHLLHTEKKSVEEVSAIFPEIKIEDIEKINNL